MSIPAYGLGALSVQRSAETFRGIKGDLAAAQTQLSTGQTAQTYSGLGSDASTALRLQSRLSTLNGYASNAGDAQLRVQLMSGGVQQMQKLGDGLSSTLSSASAGAVAGQSSAAVSAQDGLSQIIDLLNTDAAGRYLFSGRASDTRPVASYDLIMDGDSTHAGVKTLIAQRKAADLGPDGMGRLAVSSSGTGVTLREETATLPFGMKIASASATGAAITASRSAGPPPAAAIAFGMQPEPGDKVEIALTLPDGTQSKLSLVAGPAADGTTSFAIGATAAASAANLAAALGSAVSSLASTTLASASAMKAATDFFDGTASAPTARVAGPPYDTATSLTPGTAINTATWYLGDASSSSARDTAPVRVGDDHTIGVGAEAYEPAFRSILASYAVLSAESFPAGDATSGARFAALSERVTAKLASSEGSQSIKDVGTDLAVAASALGAARERVSGAVGQVQDALAGIQEADPNKAAMTLLATQTRLQASYQATAALQKLSLVNYL